MEFEYMTITDKEVHRQFNRPNLSNDLTGQDAVDYEVFLDTKRKELIDEKTTK